MYHIYVCIYNFGTCKFSESKIIGFGQPPLAYSSHMSLSNESANWKADLDEGYDTFCNWVTCTVLDANRARHNRDTNRVHMYSTYE